jgi:hypothetical protein
MKTVSGLFETDAQAKDAVAALEDAGIASGEISLVSRDGKAGSDAAEGVGIGSAVGGIGGLLAGLGAFAIPGIGPVVGAGWLATTVLGAAAGGVAGGLIGALTEAGVEERHAHVYAEHLRRGGALVTARVEDAEVDAAAAILGQSGSVDVEDRRTDYEAGGWTAFDEMARPFDARDDPDGEPHLRPVIPPLPR